MEFENKIYTNEEMMKQEIYTDDYVFNTEEGTFRARLEMKARGRSGRLRLFFRFDDGRKIITPVYWWQRYLGFMEIPVGTYLLLTYVRKEKGVFLESKEIMEIPEEWTEACGQDGYNSILTEVDS